MPRYSEFMRGMDQESILRISEQMRNILPPNFLNQNSLQLAFELRQKCASKQDFRKRYWQDLPEFNMSGAIADLNATLRQFGEKSYRESIRNFLLMGGFILVLCDAIKFGGEKSNYDLTNVNAGSLLGQIIGYAYEPQDKLAMQVIRDEMHEAKFVDVALRELTKRTTGFVGRYHILRILSQWVEFEDEPLYEHKDFASTVVHLLKLTPKDLVREIEDPETSWQIDGIIPWGDEDKVKRYAPRYFELYMDNVYSMLNMLVSNTRALPRENYSDLIRQKLLMKAMLNRVCYLSQYFVEASNPFRAASVLGTLTSLPNYYMPGHLESATKEDFDVLVDIEFSYTIMEKFYAMLKVNNLWKEVTTCMQRGEAISVEPKSASQKQTLLMPACEQVLNIQLLLISVLANLSEHAPMAKQLALHHLFDKIVAQLKEYLSASRKRTKEHSPEKVYSQSLHGIQLYHEANVFPNGDMEVAPDFGLNREGVWTLATHLAPYTAQIMILFKNVQKHTDRTGLVNTETLNTTARRMKDIYNKEFAKGDVLSYQRSIYGYTYCLRVSEDATDRLVFLNNRCEAFLRMEQFSEALDDAQAILEEDPANEKAQRRLKRAQDALKEIEDMDVL